MKSKTRKVIDGNKFRTQLAELIPDYKMGMEDDGQIIIYTNLTEWTWDDYAEMEDR